MRNGISIPGCAGTARGEVAVVVGIVDAARNRGARQGLRDSVTVLLHAAAVSDVGVGSDDGLPG